jgi:hypothetical protein
MHRISGIAIAIPLALMDSAEECVLIIRITTMRVIKDHVTIISSTSS